MVRKCDICTLADPLVIDFVPDHTRKVIDQSLGNYENVKALVKGMNNETLVVTDRGVHVIKPEGRCVFFSYDDILPGQKIFRVFRRGRFEIPVKGPGKKSVLTGDKDKPDFEPDPADNVVNFPWSKMDLFQKVEEIIDINMQKYDTEVQDHHEVEPDTACVDDLENELDRLKKKVAQLEEALSSSRKG